MAILNQVIELEDGSVTVPIFSESTVEDLFRPTLAAPDFVGFEVSFRRENGEKSGGDYHLTVHIGDRRVETTNPRDIIFATWYPKGPKGWVEQLNNTGDNRNETVLKALGNPDYLQTAQEGTPAYRELMKGYKADSLSASPDGPM